MEQLLQPRESWPQSDLVFEQTQRYREVVLTSLPPHHIFGGTLTPFESDNYYAANNRLHELNFIQCKFMTLAFRSLDNTYLSQRSRHRDQNSGRYLPEAMPRMFRS
jgi:hypothetical protein